MKYRRSVAALLCAAMLLTGCSGNKSDSDEADTSLVDRIMLTFTPALTLEEVGTNSSAVVMNYLYYLSKGEYDTALEFCYVPEGVLFDDVALQKAVLADGIGRGESIAFYNCSGSSTSMTVEYDLTSSGQIGTVNKDIAIVQGADGLFRIDISSCGYVASGELKFQVPKYVHAYINDVYIPQDEYLDANYQYDITTGIAKIPGNDTIIEYDAEGNEVSTTKAADIVLTLKTKFGIEQSYPLIFMNQGNSTKSSLSVCDEYWVDRDNITKFEIAIPRLYRESAIKYLAETAIPKLYTDLLNGTSWDSASFKSELRDDSNTASMKPDYFKMSTAFSNARLDTDGGYYFRDLSVYNFAMTDDLAERFSGDITIIDYNQMEVYFTFDYNYMYSRGSGGTERMMTGSSRGSVILSVDNEGNWYVHDISSDLFKLATP